MQNRGLCKRVNRGVWTAIFDTNSTSGRDVPAVAKSPAVAAKQRPFQDNLSLPPREPVDIPVVARKDEKSVSSSSRRAKSKGTFRGLMICLS